MNFKDVIATVTKQYHNRKPFVLYALPESHLVLGSLQNDDQCYELTDSLQKGFIFAPFNSEEKKICIPEVAATQIQANYEASEIPIEHFSPPFSEAEKERHIELVEAARKSISRGVTSKIVASRSKRVPLNGVDLEILSNRLFNLYPRAFRYIWYHPSTGLWCGATPEVLASIHGTSFTTMALAGTRKQKEGVYESWTHKERDEQQLVTDDIIDKLKTVASTIDISNTYDHIAGTLVHLRTDIYGKINTEEANLQTLANVLHPTPAICGLPQKDAQAFLLKEENYEREFYTGFLGYVRASETHSTLFVNLRCMKIENGSAHIYVGGGITQESVAESEWEETQNKMQTMLQVLWPLL